MTKRECGKKERSFWDWTGQHFPSLTGAPSTRYYLECEKSLFQEFCPQLSGKKVFKTDLWDEAKNTRILHWISKQGADVYGLDISTPMVKQAKALFKGNKNSHFIVSDLRNIAFDSASFDVIYSMGTIEHFHEYKKSIQECYRVLRPGGLILMGVPNRYDPFLRPILVCVMRVFKLYAYGYERSFGKHALQKELMDAGFEPIGLSGVLFMPGLLRMLDLFFHVHLPWATKLSAYLIRPFARLYKNHAWLRRHSYLICVAARKPQQAEGS
ncbi:MAG: class I SAM-dependent methyltransferase [Candidatus Aminicenantes bacterium]|nr:class I SAM-dependent methyltransferase [Candidatus Aminicenantes bacterium]